VTVVFENAVVGDGVAGEVGGRTNKNLKGVRFVQIGFKSSCVLGQSSFDDRFIFFLKLVPVALEGFLGLGGFCKNH